MRTRAFPIAVFLGLCFIFTGAQADAKKQKASKPKTSSGMVSATMPDPDGNPKVHAEVGWIIAPAQKQGTVTRTYKSYYENTVIVYEGKDAEHRTEIMRCGNGSNQTRNMEQKLEGGKQYILAAWHKADDPDGRYNRSELPWLPSRLAIEPSPTGYYVRIDDSRPGTGEGDKDYNDLVLTITFE